jgi:hypothetical protein
MTVLKAQFCWLHFQSGSEELAQASVSKDEATTGASWFETALKRLLTMRVQ